MSRAFQTTLLSGILAAVFAATGYVHGVWTGRFPQSISPEMALQFEGIPRSIGDWQGADVSSNLEEDTAIGNRLFLRQYVNQKDGTAVSVLLTSGKPGPMVVQHLPLECYTCAGYEIVDQPRHFKNDDSSTGDEFMVARFRKPRELVPLNVRVYWSWSFNGTWTTPERPRLAYAGVGTLYKVYFVRTMVDENEPFDGSPVHAFIQEMTRTMRETVFSTVSRE